MKKNLSQDLLSVIPFSIRIIRQLSADCLDGSVTFHHIRILILVREGQSQCQMAHSLQISEPAISKTIHTLVERKLLSKKPGKDKRSHKVGLTPEGKKILKLVESHVLDQLEEGLSNLTKAEQQNLGQGLESLQKLMQSINKEI